MDRDEDSSGAGGRRRINIELIENKTARASTFTKRKAGLMKKAYELSTLTGCQVLLLVASESGHVYTFATPKLQPIIAQQEGKNLIQKCLASDPLSQPNTTTTTAAADSTDIADEKATKPPPPQPAMLNTTSNSHSYIPQNSLHAAPPPLPGVEHPHFGDHHRLPYQRPPLPGGYLSVPSYVPAPGHPFVSQQPQPMHILSRQNHHQPTPPFGHPFAQSAPFQPSPTGPYPPVHSRHPHGQLQFATAAPLPAHRPMNIGFSPAAQHSHQSSPTEALNEAIMCLVRDLNQIQNSNDPMDPTLLAECKIAIDTLLLEQHQHQHQQHRSSAILDDPLKALPPSAQEHLLKHLRSPPPFPLITEIHHKRTPGPGLVPVAPAPPTLVEAILSENLSEPHPTINTPSSIDTAALEGQLGGLKLDSAADAKPTTTTTKRARNAYMIFAAEMRQKVKQEHPEMTFGQLGAHLGELWKRLDSIQVEHYKRLAEEEKSKLLGK